MAEGKMVIKPSTTILISNSEDRTAAETLQKEIHDRTGMKLRSKPRNLRTENDGAYLAWTPDHRGLRAYLNRKE